MNKRHIALASSFLLICYFWLSFENIAYSQTRCIELGEQGGPYTAGCDSDSGDGDGDNTVCYFSIGFSTGSDSSNQASAYSKSSYQSYSNLDSPTKDEHDSFSINADLSGCVKYTGEIFQGLWDGLGHGAAEVGKFFQNAGNYLSEDVWKPFVDSIKNLFSGDDDRDDWYKEQEERAKDAISVQDFDLKTMGKQIDDFYKGIDTSEPGEQRWIELDAGIYTTQIGMRDWFFELKAKIRYEDILPELPMLTNEDYPYETPRYTPEGTKLESLQFKIEYTNETLMENGGVTPHQADLIDGARAMGMIADDYYKENDRPSGDLFTNIGDVLLDAAVGIDPITAFARDAYGVVMGVDPITGEALSDLERVFTVGTYLMDVALPGSGYGVRALTRFGRKAVKFASKSKFAEKFVSMIRKTDIDVTNILNNPCLISMTISVNADCDLGKISGEVLEKAFDAGLTKPSHKVKYAELADKYDIEVNSISSEKNQRLGDLAKSDWSRHNNKHLKAKTEAEAKSISKNGDAQYSPSVDNKSLEEIAVIDGQKFPKAGGGYHVLHKFENVVGYSDGKPTRWIRSEITGLPGTGAYHGHPRSLQDVRKKIPNATD